jgi:hypothetical protein
MNEQMSSSEAAQALADIRQHEAQVIDVAIVPAWYWWVVAVLMVGLAAVVDSHHRVAIGISAVAFALIVAIVTIAMILGLVHGAQVNSQLLGSSGAVSIVGFIWVVLGATLGTAFGLRAAAVGHPATIATLVGAVGLVVGGPLLMRRLRRIMLANRTDPGS